MHRDTSFVLVAWIEILVVTIIGVAIVAISEQYCTGLAPWAVHVLSILLIPTLCILLVLFTIEKRDNVEGQGPGGGIRSETDKAALNEGSNDSITQGGPSPQDARSLLVGHGLISSAATAYCGMVFLVLFFCSIAFLQAVPFSYTLSGRQETVAGPQGRLYNHSQRTDWVHTTVGGSAWIGASNLTVGGGIQYTSEGLSLLGISAFAVVMGYMLVLLILCVQAAYTCTPHGHYCPLFLDPRTLTVTNFFMLMGSKSMTDISTQCQTAWGLHIAYFACLCFFVCYEEYLFMLLPLIGDTYQHSRTASFVLSVISLLPILVQIYLGLTSLPMLVSSISLALVSLITTWIRHSSIPAPLQQTSVSNAKNFDPYKTLRFDNGLETLFSIPASGRYKLA